MPLVVLNVTYYKKRQLTKLIDEGGLRVYILLRGRFTYLSNFSLHIIKRKGNNCGNKEIAKRQRFSFCENAVLFLQEIIHKGQN